MVLLAGLPRERANRRGTLEVQAMADDIPAAQRFQALALAKTLLDGGEPEPARIILQRCLPLFQAQQEPAPLVRAGNVSGMQRAIDAVR